MLDFGHCAEYIFIRYGISQASFMVTSINYKISMSFWWCVGGWITLYLIFGAINTIVVILQ